VSYPKLLSEWSASSPSLNAEIPWRPPTSTMSIRRSTEQDGPSRIHHDFEIMTRPVVASFVNPPPHFLDDIADGNNFVTALISEHSDDTAALVPEMRLAQHAARDEQGLQ
jgi:hypothetical protein